MTNVILFDGMCNLCSGSVQFILKRDPKGYFSFASLQSEMGKHLVKEHGVSKDVDSFIVIDDGKYFLKSSAAIQVSQHLRGFWKLFVIFKIVPRPVRDAVYEVVAKNRYKWFGKKDTCMMPTPETKKRFLD